MKSTKQVKEVKAIKPLAVITDKAGIEKAIASVANRGAKLDADIHLAAVSIMHHFAAHNDITLANRLIDAMPKSGRKNALILWFTTYGKFVVNTDKETKKIHHLVYNREGANDLVGAESNPFWNIKAQEGGAVFVMDKYMHTIESKLTAQIQALTGIEKVRAEFILKAIHEASKLDLVASEAVSEAIEPATM